MTSSTIPDTALNNNVDLSQVSACGSGLPQEPAP
jgi:hypothetical protein